jgi:hypothetical protein
LTKSTSITAADIHWIKSRQRNNLLNQSTNLLGQHNNETIFMTVIPRGKIITALIKRL